jgi:hypothetical protein
MVLPPLWQSPSRIQTIDVGRVLPGVIEPVEFHKWEPMPINRRSYFDFKDND